ncbi:MAG: DUF222 domain-containing protein [Nocardioides sp.]
MAPAQPHAVLALADALDAALKDVADLDPCFMRTAEKEQALTRLTALGGRLEELRLRVLAAADDVAAEHGARDAAAWLAHEARLDRGESRRSLRLAEALAGRRGGVATGMREGSVNPAQAAVIVRALEELPDDLDAEVVRQAEARLVAEAERFGPRQLRILGRRILDVVAPELGEEHERRLLEREEAHAARSTFLTTRRRGDGTTDISIRVADIVADRLLTYVQAFTSPRQSPGDLRPYDQRLGHAFGAFLEAVDPARLPLHGGDATTVIVTVDHETLVDGLDTALLGDTPITAGAARRLACTAGIIPAVLGGESEILDLGRSRRLFSTAQRKAMAIRDRTCRAEGCDIPAAWCEAHHAADPWSQEGKTDLADGLLLCSWHHHRAHDHRYRVERTGDRRVTFHRRT